MNYRIIYAKRPTAEKGEYALVKDNYIMYIPTWAKFHRLKDIISASQKHFKENSNIHPVYKLTAIAEYKVLTAFNKKTYKEALNKLIMKYPEYMI